MAGVSAELEAGVAAAAALTERLSGRRISLRPERDQVVLRPDGSDMTVCVTGDDWNAACEQWAAGSAHLEQRGLVVDAAALAALVAAAAVFRLACALSSAQPTLREDVLSVQALVALAWLQTTDADGRRRPWCFRGFIECANGSAASLALGNDNECELSARALSSDGWPPALPLPTEAGQVCEELQLWGIAAVPAGELASASAEGGSLAALPTRDFDDVRGLVPPGNHFEGRPVLIAGNLVAAPFAGVLLSALGAEVLHIHHPLRPPLRFGRLSPTPSEAVDLETPAGRARFQTLLTRSDALVENLRPRALANLGRLPALARIGSHVSLPGFATSTPARNWRSLGFQLEALVGCGVRPLSSTTEIRGPLPLVSDFCAAFVGAAASLLRLPQIELPQSSLLAEIGGRYSRKD